MTPDEALSLISKTWANKTLEELRLEADREQTGICFESIRIAGGRRQIIVVCLTDIDQIASVEKVLDLIDDAVIEDWNTLTLVEVAARSIRAGTLTFESLRDEFGRRTTLSLSAADPCSITILEALLKMPG